MSDRSIQKFKEYVQKLNPIDDIIFRKMAENREFCEEILRLLYTGKLVFYILIR